MKKTQMAFSIILLAFISLFGQDSVLYLEVQQAQNSNIRFENVAFEETRAEVSVLERFVNPNEVFF